MRTIKKNFWKPFLFGCLSLTVATIAFAGISMQIYVPQPPGVPYAEDWDNSSCHLIFTPPVSDGGSPITLYRIEGRDKTSPIWIKRGNYNNPGPNMLIRCSVTMLTEGHGYTFRSIAENIVGKSRPSGESDLIIIKNR